MSTDANGAGSPIVSVADIKAAVSSVMHVNQIEFVSRRMRREVTLPRQIAMALCYELTPMSSAEIGRHFGDRDHTTVLHAVDAIKMRRGRDPSVAQSICQIKHILGAE